MAQEELGLGPHNLWHYGSGFGGGVAGCGHTCGALTGAAIAIGVTENAHPRPDGQTHDRISAAVRRIHDELMLTLGSTDCSAISGYVLREDGQFEAFKNSGVKKTRCYQAVGIAVKWLAKWSQESGLDQ